MTPEKLNKLILRLQSMAQYIKEQKRDLVIQQNLDWFGCLEMAERLSILKEKLEESTKHLETVNGFVTSQYQEVFYNWKKDMRWLSDHCRNRPLQEVNNSETGD